MADLGKVLIIPRGEYNNSTNYSELDLVTFKGSSYISLKPSVGHLPTETEYWQLQAQGFSGNATDLDYDNTNSHLSATTVQGAIDEHSTNSDIHVNQGMLDKIDKAINTVGQSKVNEVAIYNDENGNIKSSGFTIESSVPANAKFTDTIYEHPDSGVIEGDYQRVHVDKQGHVTAGSNPTTLSGYGITDAAPIQHQHGNNDITSLDVSKLTGIINIENLPQGALEYCAVVENDLARFALTTNEVQKGDTVKVNDTNVMYIVTDDTKLNTEEGYIAYGAGNAASVPWSGVTGKPNTFVPESHTHTKAEIGLEKVENKNSEDIRGELTPENVTKALGFVPANNQDLNGFKIIPFDTTATTLSELINRMPDKSIMITEITEQIATLLQLPNYPPP